MVAALAHSLVHKLLVRLDLFSFFFFLVRFFTRRRRRRRRPHSKLHCGQKSWTSPTLYHHPLHHPNRHTRLLGFDSRTSSRGLSSVRHPSRSQLRVLLFYSFLSLFIFPVWRAPCLTALPSPLFFHCLIRKDKGQTISERCGRRYRRELFFRSLRVNLRCVC